MRSTSRLETDEYGKKLYIAAKDADRRVVERVGEIATEAWRPAGAGRAGVAAA